MHTYKSKDWYWIVGIVTLTLSAIAIILGDPVFGVFMVIASFTLCLAASREPEEVTHVITDRGVKNGEVLYPWNILESFWVEEYELHPRLLLKAERRWAPYLVILLSDEVTPDDVREKLSNHLPEVRHAEPFLERLFIWLGF